MRSHNLRCKQEEHCNVPMRVCLRNAIDVMSDFTRDVRNVPAPCLAILEVKCAAATCKAVPGGMKQEKEHSDCRS